MDKFIYHMDCIQNRFSFRSSCFLKSWLKIMFKGISRLLKVIGTYLDLSSDLILLISIMKVLTFNMEEFFTFPWQA